MRRWCIAIWIFCAGLLLHDEAMAQSYKTAPPEEVLEAQARDYVTRRRVVALILIGGTLAGGLLSSISRRRARARAEAAARNSAERSSIDAETPEEER